MGLIEWAQSPWGKEVPIHIAFGLLWVSAIGGLLFLIVHAIYVGYWAKSAETHAGEAVGTASGVAARVPERRDLADLPLHHCARRDRRRLPGDPRGDL